MTPPSQERKYFDSGDYALSKAGKASDTGVTTIGTEHPQAENIPHLSATSPPNSASSPSGNVPGSIIGSSVHSSLHHHSQEGSHFLPGAGGNRGSIHGMPTGPGIPIGRVGVTSRSPIKEGSYLARSASIDEQDGPEAGARLGVTDDSKQDKEAGDADGDDALGGVSVSPPPIKEGLPIRR